MTEEVKGLDKRIYGVLTARMKSLVNDGDEETVSSRIKGTRLQEAMFLLVGMYNLPGALNDKSYVLKYQDALKKIEKATRLLLSAQRCIGSLEGKVNLASESEVSFEAVLSSLGGLDNAVRKEIDDISQFCVRDKERPRATGYIIAALSILMSVDGVCERNATRTVFSYIRQSEIFDRCFSIKYRLQNEKEVFFRDPDSYYHTLVRGAVCTSPFVTGYHRIKKTSK